MAVNVPTKEIGGDERLNIHQGKVDPPARTEQGSETGSNHHGGEHEWNSSYCTKKWFTAKIEMGKKISDGQPNQQRE
jgi:hypothetical protein